MLTSLFSSLPVVKNLNKIPRVIRTLIMGVALLIGVVISSIISQQLESRANTAVNRVLEIETTLAKLMTIAQSAETGQRGYLLTGKETYLEPYQNALVEMPALLNDLNNFLDNNTIEQKDAHLLRDLLQQKFGELSETIILFSRGEEEKSLQLVKKDIGKELMEDIQKCNVHLKKEINDKLQINRRKLAVLQNLIVGFQVFALLAMLGIIYYVYSTIAPLFKEITETNKELKRNKESLETKNAQLEQFTYIASHDLSEPLRTVTSFVDILEEEYRPSFDEQGQQYLDYISESANRMHEMVNGLLMFTRIGKATSPRQVETNKVLQKVTENLAEEINVKGARVSYEHLPTLFVYPADFEQLFEQLIQNALKFSTEKPVVEITAEDCPGVWKFCVSDNGIGIKEKFQERIFGMFSKLHLRSQYQGQGMGLAFCQKIVELHDGKIWVESKPGKGSSFYFTIAKRIT